MIFYRMCTLLVLCWEVFFHCIVDSLVSLEEEEISARGATIMHALHSPSCSWKLVGQLVM